MPELRTPGGELADLADLREHVRSSMGLQLTGSAALHADIAVDMRESGIADCEAVVGFGGPTACCGRGRRALRAFTGRRLSLALLYPDR